MNTFDSSYIERYWFSIGNSKKYPISEETYEKANEYFENANYDKLKIELKKSLLNKKIKKIAK